MGFPLPAGIVVHCSVEEGASGDRRGRVMVRSTGAKRRWGGWGPGSRQRSQPWTRGGRSASSTTGREEGPEKKEQHLKRGQEMAPESCWVPGEAGSLTHPLRGGRGGRVGEKGW